MRGTNFRLASVVVVLILFLSALALAQQATTSIECPNQMAVVTGQTASSVQVQCQPTPVPPPPGVIVSNAAQFSTAIGSGSSAQPGDTIWLHGGTYAGSFNATAAGTQAAPITIRGYPGEKAVLTCANQSAVAVVTLTGAYLTLRDVEITCAGADRALPIASGVAIYGVGDKVINCLVHDTGGGFGQWSPAIDSEIYGNLIYRNGWQGPDPDRGHGHGLYIQGDQGTRYARDNVIFDQYGYGIHAYTQSGFVRGITIEGNFVFGSGILARQIEAPNVFIAGYTQADRITLANNISYQPLDWPAYNYQLYYSTWQGQSLTMTGNYIAGGYMLYPREWQRIISQFNTVVGKSTSMQVALPDGVATSAYTLTGNNYVGIGNTPTFKPLVNRINGTWTAYTLAQWQSLGWDVSGSYQNVAAATDLPAAVFVRPNRYEPGRANIAIYNWPHATSVAVDASNVLVVGDAYEVQDVRNQGVVVASGTYTGAALNIPTPNEFAAFLLRKR